MSRVQSRFRCSVKAVNTGITRIVVLTKRYAFKFPRPSYFVRGWLANRSEWKRRNEPNVSPPLLTTGHFVLVMRQADRIATEQDDGPFGGRDEFTYLGDEQKPSNWGLFGNKWLLIDYDRSWVKGDRGIVGSIYWANQERLGRKWSKLPRA